VILQKQADNKPKKNKPGAGRPCGFDLIEKVVLTLMYYRCYMTQACLGDMFGLSQSNASRIIGSIEPFIEQAADPDLSKPFKRIEQDNAHIQTLNRADFIKEYPEFERVVTDATETPIPRPGMDNETRKLYYSGKKKRFTLKTLVSTDSNKKFLHITATYPGSYHDKTIMDIERTIENFPAQTHQLLDLGYQGVVQEYPDHYVSLPVKKQPHCELSELAKEANKNTSKRRVIVENALARLKNFAICVQIYNAPAKRAA
jgi:hypothetical protein